MTVEVRVRPRETEEERCPYCHDALVDEGEREHRIECPACHTWHHLACILELGRCTIRGCERSLEVARERAAGAARSRAYDEVARRIRERVRSFVRENCRKPASGGELAPLLQAALLHARRAERQRRWEEASDWWGEAARIEMLARPGDLAQATDRVDPDVARARAESMLVWARWWAVLGALKRVLLLLAAVTILALVLFAIRSGL